MTVVRASLTVQCPAKKGPLARALVEEVVPDSPDNPMELSPVDFTDIKFRLEAMLNDARQRILEQLDTIAEANHARRRDQPASDLDSAQRERDDNGGGRQSHG